MEPKKIFTIGHSTRTWDEFVGLLQHYEITSLVDVRTFPGSKRYPHFNKLHLTETLPSTHIAYHHLSDLGGRRKPATESTNTAWRNASFKGYADHMETVIFKEAIAYLESLALSQRVAYMCSEAVWWRCHRALISDYLKNKGWVISHILGLDKYQEHPYSSPAKVVQGQLFYN